MATRRVISQAEGKKVSDVVFGETNAVHTKGRRLVEAGSYQLGEVLAKVGLKYVKLNLAADDSAKVAKAMCLSAVTLTTDEQIMLQLRDTGLHADGLVWPAAMTDAQRAVAIDQLDDVGLVVL